jgi:dihydrofolate reductase
MKISIIVARSTQGVIGRDNELPWRLPADLKHFKSTTLGHPIIMGRNTWESLGRPLPDRRNIVISRTPGFSAEDAETFSSLEDALSACETSDQIFIIGGAQVYEQAIEFADEMIITEVQIDVVGDAHFPEFEEEDWRVTNFEEHPPEPDPKNPGKEFPAFAFVTYTRK